MSFREMLLWFIAVITLVIVGVIGFAVWTVRNQLPLLGNFILVCVACFFVIALVASAIFVAQLLFKADTIEIGQHGVAVRWFGQVKTLAPLNAAPARTATEKAAAIKQVVPTVKELLENGTLALGNPQLLLGFDPTNMSPIMGIWDDLKTFGVAGFARVGKTTTMLFYIIQALLGGATVWVADIHITKASGLLKQLQPLQRWVRGASTLESVVAMFQAYADELESRKRGSDASQVMLLICDEWNGLLEDLRTADSENDTDNATLVADIVTKLCREAAGYGMYGMLAIHTWTDREIGGVPLRRNLLGVVCHAIDEGYSKLIFNSKKDYSRTPNLQKGKC